MAQVEIRNALETRLAAWATANSLTVLWENDDSPPVAESHIRPVMYPSPTANPSLGTQHKRYRGIFRIQCWLDKLNLGPAEVESVAESLVDYFPRGLQLTKGDVTVHIENTPSQSGISPESNHCVVSVEMVYRADVITI